MGSKGKRIDDNCKKIPLMALICTNPQFIFIHIYKVGGMSVRTFFNTYDPIVPLSLREVGKSHNTLAEVKELYVRHGYTQLFEQSFKFAFVRNPFDWTVSLYHFILNTESHESHEQIKTKNFNEFCHWLSFAVNNQLKTDNGAYHTMTEYVYDREWNCLADFVGRLENFDADMKTIADKLFLRIADIPKVNVTPNRESDYRSYYDSESRETIEKLFAYDLKHFGYEF